MAALTGPNDIPQKVGDEIRIAQAAVKIWRGAAVAVIDGVGYATNLVPGTAGTEFIGVALETSDNSNGTPGTFTYNAPLTGYSPFIRVARRGAFVFGISGTAPTQANIGEQVWFTDNQTVSLTTGLVLAGTIVTIDEAGLVWVEIVTGAGGGGEFVANGWTPLTGSTDAIDPTRAANYIINTAGVDAMTLGAPTAVVDDGKQIVIMSGTANAHTITATGLLNTGAATVNVATFAAHPGASLTLRAYNAKWYVIAQNAITFT